MMSLVEIVRPLTASDETIAAVTAFAEACGKNPVEVKDRAGFIVNALLFPYLNNAVRMLENGTASRRRHRHRHEGRLQLPDGPARPARPRRASTRRSRSSTPSTTSSATRTTPPCPPCAAWSPPASSAGSPASASTTTPGSDRLGPRTETVDRHRRTDDARPMRRASSRTDRPGGVVRSRTVRIEPPPSSWVFPPVDGSDPDGPVAIGGDLEPGTLLAAYRAGLFPMPLGRRRKIGWWSPDPRGVLPLDGLIVSRSLRRSLRRYEVRVDTAFVDVVRACADPDREHGWIDADILAAYSRLHELGWAHSVEAWDGRPARRRALRRRDRRRSSPASRCSTTPRTHRRSRSCTSSSCCATASIRCSTCSGRPLTWHRSEWSRSRVRSTSPQPAGRWPDRRRGRSITPWVDSPNRARTIETGSSDLYNSVSNTKQHIGAAMNRCHRLVAQTAGSE